MRESRRSLRRRDTQTETWRTQEVLKLKRLHTAYWPRAVGADGPPDLQAAKFVMSIRERLAKLLGLDAPQQIAIAARQVVEVNYNHVHTLQGAESPEVEGTADDPRIRMPSDLKTYQESGWLEESGATAALAGPNGAHADVDDAEVVDEDDDE